MGLLIIIFVMPFRCDGKGKPAGAACERSLQQNQHAGKKDQPDGIWSCCLETGIAVIRHSCGGKTIPARPATGSCLRHRLFGVILRNIFLKKHAFQLQLQRPEWKSRNPNQSRRRLHPPPVKPEPGATASPDMINWEQFMGAKLFAWIGGLALFLGVAFFVKYSFDHNLIPPATRAAIGFAAGLGLLGGGMAMKRKETAVTAQTLSSTGVLVLYGVTYACRSLYHFAFFTAGARHSC